MAQKLMKLKIHPRNFCEEELIVNVDALAKDKFQVAADDIIEISVPSAATSNSRVCLQVKLLPQDIQTKGGPLSINKELAQLYNLEGVKEVNVRKVDKEEVGIDLLELKFKDQCLTRSDMWRFTCSLIGKCVYLTKKLEFVTIRTQVSGLWSQGEEVQCGAVVNETRVVFRSASSQVFLLIQISSEMWEFDTSGDLYFDKLVGGFLKELFHRWTEECCSHEVTLAFFWRVYYNQDQLDQLPKSVSEHVQTDKRNLFYEDFYKVIVEAECVSDWNNKVKEIKRSFITFDEALCSARGENAKVSSSAEGNVLEAINLAINIFDKGYIDCNFLLTGQQVAIVTAGVGVFEVDHDLSRMTKERIIDGGIGVDLVCLTEQPLHAVPLFRFHQSTTLDDQEYYHIPHWINYSFYNPLQYWNRFQFRPQLKISDHLINIHLNRGERRTKGTKLYNSYTETLRLPHCTQSVEPLPLMKSRLDDRIQDSDLHDELIFASLSSDPLPNKTVSMNKVQSMKMRHHVGQESTRSLGARVMMKTLSSERKNVVGSYHGESTVKFEIGESPPDPFDAPLDKSGESPGSRSTGGIEKARLSRDFTATIQPIVTKRSRFRSDSEFQDPSSSYKNPSSFYGSLTRIGSVESAHGMMTPRSIGTRSRGMTTPLGTGKRRGFFINPFDPSKMHTEITAYHRRWMHTFPRNRDGFLFQIHHAILEELAETSSLGSSMSRHSSVSSVHLTVGGEEGMFGRRRRYGSMSLDERDALRSGDMSLSGGGGGPRDSSHSGGSSRLGTDSGKNSFRDQILHLPGDSRSSSGDKIPGLDVNSTLNSTKASVSPKPHPLHMTDSAKPHPSHPIGGSDINSEAVKLNQQIVMAKKAADARKLAEDFASVRRTGVDWKSLTEPACLPITTDYFPLKTKLANDYYEHPSKLLVSSYNYGEEEFPDTKTTLPWRTNHQHMTTFKAFQEMISQRLTQGFQLVFDVPRDRSSAGEGRSRSRISSGHDSIFSLHQAILEQREAIYSKTRSRKGHRHGDIAAKFSLGRVFHKVELAYPDLVISIYKSKAPRITSKLFYSYQLCGLTSDPTMGPTFQRMRTSFHHMRVEDYNWNYLDQHICGHSDFEELGESQKYWRCRYLLLPLESPKFGEGEEAATREARQLIANFVRFMDFLNHIKRTPQPTAMHGRAPAGFVPRRQMSLPASHAGLLSPIIARSGSRTPTPQDPHSNVTSPTSITAALMAGHAHQRGTNSPTAGRSRSRQRKLPEIGEEQHRQQFGGPSPGEADQRRSSDQSSDSRTPEDGRHQMRQRSQSPLINGRREVRGGKGMDVRERGRNGQKRSKRSQRKKPANDRAVPGAKNVSEEMESLQQAVSSRADIFERGYDDEPVDTRPISPRPISPRPPKARQSPLLLRRRSRDDLIAAASADKKDTKDLQFGVSKTKRDHSLDRTRSPRGSLKRKSNNVPVEVTPPTPVMEAPPSIASGEANSTVDSDPVSTSTISSFDDGISILNTASPPQLIIKGLQDSESGIDFLSAQPGLKAGCFLAMEAVDWVMEQVSGATTREKAVNVLQVLVSERLIIHASGDFRVPFLDGYFIYSMPERERQEDTQTKENMDRSFLIIDPMDFNTFSKCWFEVGIRHPSKLDSPANTTFDPSPSFNSPYISLSNFGNQQPFYMDFNKPSETLEIPTYMANRYVELNPDPQSRSDRPEWCYVRYDHTYHPLRAFQFELQWMVTTIEIFHQLIQSWTHRANMCGFTLVAVPMLQSLPLNSLDSPHPFRRPLFIPLSLPPSIDDLQLPQFELVTRVLSEIINNTGFLLDPGSRQKDSSDILSPRHEPGDFLSITLRFYIHHSGCSLIQPVCESTDEEADILPDIEKEDIHGSQTSSKEMEARYSQEKHNKQERVLSLPRSSSTPSSSPVELKGLWLCRSMKPSLKCGFYWHRNYLLPKQKNISSKLLSQHDQVLSELTKLCSGEDGRLDNIFEKFRATKLPPPL